jgi:hypothetical protein
VKFIYMSEELKKKDMDVSRATVVQSGEKLTYGGPLRLVKDGQTVAWLKIDPKGLESAPEHHVRAWIETDCEVAGE